MELFSFPFLFPSYCHSVVHRVISIVSDGCNETSIVFLYIIFELLYWCVNAVFNAGKSSSFLDTNRQSTSFLGCKALGLVISFLVLWSICFCSPLVYLRKGPEYLTSGTAQVFIPLIRFRQESFVSSDFLVLLRCSFFILSFISTCLMVSASKMPRYS